jgi:hypothetical protein
VSQLVAYFDQSPMEAAGDLGISQLPKSAASAIRAINGEIRAGVVYVRLLRATGAVHVPFAEYDEWSLRDRYNEALRIMNSLGATSIKCETFGESSKIRSLGARLGPKTAALAQQRVKNSAFDYQTTATGSNPRDPRPLSWPDEPGFDAAVSSVLDNGATEVELNVRCSRSHEFDGAIGTQLRKVGFDLGVKTQSSGVTNLHIVATFDRSRRRWR